MLFLALIISGSISKESRGKDTASSVTLMQLDTKSNGHVVSSCSLSEMPEPARFGHTMDGDWACGGSPGAMITYIDITSRREFGRSFLGDFQKLGDCISLTGGSMMTRLKSWWKGENWTRTHRGLAHARYLHVSWRVPEGLVLMGGAGAWRSAQLVRDDGTSEDLFEIDFNLM